MKTEERKAAIKHAKVKRWQRETDLVLVVGP